MNRPAGSKKGLSRLISATRNSISGFRTAWRSEAAFRQEMAVAIILLPAALWVGQTLVERLFLIAAVLVVIITELLNTAIEFTIDRIGTDHHELSGRAKDIASAAVMTAILLWLLVWIPLVYLRLSGF